MHFPENSVELNRRFLTLMGRLNVLPCAFELQGKRIRGRVSRLRFICWKIQLALSILYALYINMTLVVNATPGLDGVDKFDLGTHLTRAMVSASWSYWAYQVFVACFADQGMLYEFAQWNAVLTRHPAKGLKKKGVLQDWLLVIAPFAIYGFSPLPAGIFLWDSSSNQFLWALLPASAQRSVILWVLAAAYEFHVVLMWMAVSHFGCFHCLTFLRVIQRQLINHAANLK